MKEIGPRTEFETVDFCRNVMPYKLENQPSNVETNEQGLVIASEIFVSMKLISEVDPKAAKNLAPVMAETSGFICDIGHLGLTKPALDSALSVVRRRGAFGEIPQEDGKAKALFDTLKNFAAARSANIGVPVPALAH